MEAICQYGGPISDPPVELREQISDKVDGFSLGLEEAKELRLELMEERKTFVHTHTNVFEANGFFFASTELLGLNEIYNGYQSVFFPFHENIWYSPKKKYFKLLNYRPSSWWVRSNEHEGSSDRRSEACGCGKGADIEQGSRCRRRN